MPIFWKIYFLVTRDYGSKWLPSFIQYGEQMTTDQNMPRTFFWPLDDIFTLFKVKPNPLKYAHSTYTRSKRNFQFDNTHHLILWVLSVFLEFL